MPKAATKHEISLGGRHVDYRVLRSDTARKLRVRVGPSGVDLLQPSAGDAEEVVAFLDRNQAWVLNQLQRVERLRGVRRPEQRWAGDILFRGVPTRIRIQTTGTRALGNAISLDDGEIVVHVGSRSATPVAQSLESWLRRQARAVIEAELAAVVPRLGREPARVYVMGQRTKWGNCSALGNLSFNWRLILAPSSVLRYLVTHEAVHLVVPDHSAKFWLTVASLCPGTEVARQWLSTRASDLQVNLDFVCADRSRLASADEAAPDT